MRAPLVLAAIAAAWAQEPGAIEGTVTNAAIHAPIAGVRVTIDKAGVNETLERRTVTDGSGAYRVEDLPAGNYVATFEAVDHVTVSSPVVQIGGTPVRVNAQLWPAAKVLGRVLDDEGRPAAAVPVELYGYRGGRPILVKTDADGRFVFPSVAAGVYAVAARPQPKTKEGAALAPTWFPGFTDRTQAERVIVRAGAEVPGIEIRLRRVPVWTVEGAATDEQNRPLGKVAVKLRPADEWQPDQASTVTSADGTFRFTGVRPGEWRLAAVGSGREGYASLAVDKHDVERLAVRLFPPFEFSGFIEREEPRDSEGKRKLSGVYLVPEAGEGKQVMAFHEQDGVIRFPKVQPGRYTIFPVGYIPGYYVDSVKLGDQEVMARPVDLTNGAIPFRVIYRPNAGRVRGSVENGLAGMVALVPQDEALLDGQFIRTSKCDTAGRFEVGSLKPGEYYAFAFDRVDRDALSDVSFVRSLRNAAVPVHVEAGKAADVELKLTPWPE
jgi:5-hydroxyisourate hydrolase-like protein (transthyretin family)